ncbi:hypothetical protein OGAPHI_000068 [Ogataea philodendri]|uniref:Uncharacterized protein n=1 Tax=Ogataea philodendri TaxID=1378263 RepID=A0A9P8PGY8_9ASCO|nr:uncharacterized protein OGAPHI_000068 [Ogataea philodendri]KAH3671882.1 hypothetical protein OGAPHI_000068 [Ogataea philodendri]
MAKNSAVGEKARSEIESSGPLGTTMSFWRSCNVPADVPVPPLVVFPKEAVPKAPKDQLQQTKLQQRIVDVVLLLSQQGDLGLGAFLQRSSGGLQQHVLVRLDGLGQSNWVLQDVQLHRHLVGLQQVALLSQSLDSVDQLSHQSLRLQLWVHVDVQDDQNVSLGSDFLSARDLGLRQASKHRQVLLHKIDTSNLDLSGLEELLHIVGSKAWQSVLDLLGVLLQLLSKNRPVGHGSVLDTVLGLVGSDDQVSHVQLLNNVVLQSLNVLKVRWVGVENNQLLQWSLQRDGLLFSDVSSQINDLLHSRHSKLDLLINQRLVHNRIRQEVDRVGALTSEKSIGQCVHGLQTIVNTVLALQSLSVETNVPVGQLVNQVQQLWNNGVQTVLFHLSTDELDQRLDRGQQPAVHNVCRSGLWVVLEVNTFKFLEQSNLAFQELVGVPPWQQNLRNNLLDTFFFELQGLGSQDWRVYQVQSQSVSTVRIQDIHWVWVVFQSLGHLLTVSSKNNTRHNNVLVWSTTKQVSSQHSQSVEPTSGLIQTFRYEVGWESTGESLLVVSKWIVLGSKRHGTRLEPTVENVLDSLQLTLTLLRWNGQVVNFFSVNICNGVVSSELSELLDRSNTDNFLFVVRNPQWQWSTPVSLSGDVPVSGVGNPVGETLVLDVGRNPSGLVDGLEHLRHDLLDSDEPRRNGSVDQRGVGSPTEWITVSDLRSQQQSAVSCQFLDNLLVCILDVQTSEIGHLAGKFSVVVHWVRRNQGFVDNACLSGSFKIDFTKSWSLVNNTRTGVVGDESVAVHPETGLLEILVKVVENRLVFPAVHFLTENLSNDLVFGILWLWIQVLDQRLQHDVSDLFLLVVDLGILELWIHTKSNVRRQGPWGGCPGKKNCLGVVFQWETNGDSWVIHVFIVQLGLEIGQRGRHTGGIRHHSVTLVNSSLFEQLLECPPFRLHKLRIKGLVIIVEIDPSPQSTNSLSPFVGVSHHNGSTLLVVLGNAHIQNVLFGLDTQLLVDLVFNRQSMGIPSKPSFNIVTIHGGISRNNVLGGGSQNVTIMGSSCCKWRTIIKGKLRVSFRQLQRLMKGVDLIPVFQHFFLLFREGKRLWVFFSHDESFDLMTPVSMGGLLWKKPWRLSSFQKYRHRKRMQLVDSNIQALYDGLKANGLSSNRVEHLMTEYPKESEMLPKNKYTVFSKYARKYRKGIHFVPKWTRLPLRKQPSNV